MGVQGLVVKLEWPEQQSKNIEANASIMIMFKKLNFDQPWYNFVYFQFSVQIGNSMTDLKDT